MLSPRFGYRVHDAVVMELYHPLHRWFRVRDPGAAGRRVMFRSHSRTVMYVVAERIGPVPEFIPPPTQSVYATEWDRLRAPDLPDGETSWSPEMSTASPPPHDASDQSRPGATERAKGLALRHLPGPLLRSMSHVKDAVPVRMKKSRRIRRLKIWAVWAVPLRRSPPALLKSSVRVRARARALDGTGASVATSGSPGSGCTAPHVR